MNQSEARLRDLKSWDAPAMAELASLSQVRSWKFAAKSNFKAEALSELSLLPMLEFLSLEESELESANLRSLSSVASLRRIDLKGCQFDADDFRYLCEQWVQGVCPKLQEVWLEGTRIGDDDLHLLGQIERLRWLTLANTQISDAGLEHLRWLKKLETLWLQNTRVSESGVLRLAVLPHLSIVVLDGPSSEQTRDKLFRAQIALRKSKKPINQVQLDAADARLRAFLAESEDWEQAAYRRANDIETRHKAERPLPNQMAEAESQENTDFWRNIGVQKAEIAARYCSQKLLSRGAGSAGSFGDPPQFQREDEWIDFETPSKQKTIFLWSGALPFPRKTPLHPNSRRRKLEIRRSPVVEWRLEARHRLNQTPPTNEPEASATGNK